VPLQWPCGREPLIALSRVPGGRLVPRRFRGCRTRGGGPDRPPPRHARGSRSEDRDALVVHQMRLRGPRHQRARQGARPRALGHTSASLDRRRRRALMFVADPPRHQSASRTSTERGHERANQTYGPAPGHHDASGPTGSDRSAVTAAGVSSRDPAPSCRPEGIRQGAARRVDAAYVAEIDNRDRGVGRGRRRAAIDSAPLPPLRASATS
jgi:hypothetical protein